MPAPLSCRLLLTVWLPLAAAQANSLEDAANLLQKGNHAEALTAVEPLMDDSDEGLPAHALKICALLATGRHADALAATEAALAVEDRDFRILWAAREAFRFGGQPEKAEGIPAEIERLMRIRDWAYTDAASICIYGRVLLLRGVDPKTVLDKIYAVAQKREPKSREPYLARGELALEKNDFALAAKAFREGLKQVPDDADLHFGLARAFEPSDREQMATALDAALKNNPNHVPSHLLTASLQIDREDYTGADETLAKVEKINPHHPEMWASRAVLAHLRHQPAEERAAREAALASWPTNPRVDHLIGQKLSRKYRFAEGAAAQRRALGFDPAFLPAQAQLANDLLRLGDEDEGWKLAAEVHERDGYDVSVFNLVTLRDAMEKTFATLRTDEFTVRMSAAEAPVYGQRVLDLLTEARRKLGEKYGIEVARPTIVEIFPKQRDFGVRTFGMPDNPGFLGVCFGRVVTANSPAANPATPVNWEAVLWHEFCHTVTLQATANKMPRWLSEGISVHEETQADPSWGEHLDPVYRGMILGGELTPVSELSGAFLAPKTPQHLQFAYFESALVVRWIIENKGLDALKAVLADLRTGTFINDALARRVAPIDELEAKFAAWAKELAEGLAPALDFTRPEPELFVPGNDAALAAWAKEHPDNFHVLLREAVRLQESPDPSAAIPVLQKLIERFPTQRDADSARLILAGIHRKNGNTAEERRLLAEHAALDAAAPAVNERLMQLAADAGDWPEVVRQAKRHLAVNPLVTPPWRRLAEASEKTGNPRDAATAWKTVLALDPPNPAEVHFRLAKALQAAGDPAAKRHVLMTLEEAPRHREALQLLESLPK